MESKPKRIGEANGLDVDIQAIYDELTAAGTAPADGETSEEIAERIGTTPQTVLRRLTALAKAGVEIVVGRAPRVSPLGTPHRPKVYKIKKPNR